MPELPEVETIVRELRPQLVGRRLTRVRVSRLPLRRRWQPAWTARLKAQRVEVLRRRGKWIVAELSGGLALLIHLGMTGQLRVLPAAAPAANHTHLVFDLDGGKQLRFRDVRRFGMPGCSRRVLHWKRSLKPPGWAPSRSRSVPTTGTSASPGRAASLKAVLLDQTVVAGVGNIYADEALYEASLHPALERPPRQCRPGRAAAPGHHRRPQPRHRQARLQHSRLRRRQRNQGRLSARISGVRPVRKALPALPATDPPRPPRGRSTHSAPL